MYIVHTYTKHVYVNLYSSFSFFESRSSYCKELPTFASLRYAIASNFVFISSFRDHCSPCAICDFHTNQQTQVIGIGGA